VVHLLCCHRPGLFFVSAASSLEGWLTVYSTRSLSLAAYMCRILTIIFPVTCVSDCIAISFHHLHRALSSDHVDEHLSPGCPHPFYFQCVGSMTVRACGAGTPPFPSRGVAPLSCSSSPSTPSTAAGHGGEHLHHAACSCEVERMRP
jgi:hypothetical protein